MKKPVIALLAILLISCNPNHTSEYNSISRNDIEGYEEFISKYPDSKHVADARERIETAKEEQRRIAAEKARIQAELEAEQRRAVEQARLEERQRQLERQYGYNSLSNESQPYAQWYGKNLYYDDYTPHSEIRVTAPASSDVIAIVRHNNHNGKVAGHKYIKAGHSATIYLKNKSYYQTFFYYGNGWYPDKKMKNGIKGGFIKNELFSKDGTPSYLDNNILTYELVLTQHGNFSTSSSNENEIF